MMKTLILEILPSLNRKLRNPMNRAVSPCRSFVILLLIAGFALLPMAQAADGDLGGGNTSEGFNALNALTTGGFNTALGWYSQAFLTDGFFNTAAGAGSLDINNGNSNTAAGTGAMLLNIAAGQNTAVGTLALELNDFTATAPPTAEDNTGLGFQALWLNHDGGNNTAVGSGALTLNDSVGTSPATANANTAVGRAALFSNVDGAFNTAVGFFAMVNNDLGNPGPGSTANANTAIGGQALAGDPVVGNTGAANNAVGVFALSSNQTGNANQAMGNGALGSNATGIDNVAIGHAAMLFNDLGSDNTAVGFNALLNNTIGAVNTGVGSLALFTNTTGTENTAVGRRALQNLDGGHENTAVGWGAGQNYTGTETRNICIGDAVGGTVGENDNIRIGDNLPSNGIVIGSAPGVEATLIGTGQASEGIAIVETILGSTMQLGAGLPTVGTSTFIGGIVGNPNPSAGSIFDVNIETAAGPNFQRLGIDMSSRRYKDDIKPMNELSEAIYKLHPVTYRVKKEINPAQPMTFGLIAEDVAEACPALASYLDGQPLGVQYRAMSVMLLNEFLKEHKKVEEQQSRIEKQQATIVELKSTVAQQRKDFEATAAQQRKEMNMLTAQLKEQAAQIQKVSTQLEMHKPAAKVASYEQ